MISRTVLTPRFVVRDRIGQREPIAAGIGVLVERDGSLAVGAVELEHAAIAVDGVMPDKNSVLRNKYPISRPLFMYTNGEPTGHVGAYLNWIKSDEGQCIILEKGYAPANPVTCG